MRPTGGAYRQKPWQRERAEKMGGKAKTSFAQHGEQEGMDQGGGTPAEKEERGRRTRNLLRNYYQLSADGSANNSSETISKPAPSQPAHVLANSRDIDAPNFESKTYVQRVLKQKNLDELIKTQRMMNSEIKKLDSSMKTLVYENYNKFISATDTIRQMKVNVTNMEEEMKRLGGRIEEISVCSEEVTTHLSSNRDTIERLSAVSRLLKKRQFLFELPSRLEKCLELEAYGTAVRYYKGTKHILEKYKALPALTQIQADVKEIKKRLEARLRSRVDQFPDNSNVVVDSITLLLDLDYDVNSLRDRFLKWKVDKLNASLMKASTQELPKLSENSSNDENNKNDTGDEEEKRMILFLDQLNDRFLGEFLEFISTFNDLFLSRETSTESQKQVRDQLDRFISPLLDQFCSCVTDKIITLSHTKSIISCLSFINMSMNEFISTHVAVNNNQAANKTFGDSKTKSGGLEKTYSSGQNSLLSAMKLIDTTPYTVKCISDRAVEQAKSTINSIIDLSAAKVFGFVQSGLNNPNLAESIGSVCINSATSITEIILNYFHQLRPFFDSNVASTKFLSVHTMSTTATLLKGVTVIYSSMINSINTYHTRSASSLNLPANLSSANLAESNAASNTTTNPSPPPIFLLFLARLCSLVDDMGTIKFKEKIKEFTQLVPYNAPGANEVISVNSVINDMSEDLREKSELLLSHYVTVVGVMISMMLRKSVENSDWLSNKLKEPRQVKTVILMIITEIENMSHMIDDLNINNKNVPTSNPANANNASSGSGKLGKSASVPHAERVLKSNISKLFAEKKEYMGVKVNFTSGSISMGIMRIAIKSLVESIRMKSFSRFGYQQVQVDATYLGRALRPLIENPQVIENMLDEVIDSAADRCVDYYPLEKSIILAICENQNKKKMEQNQTTGSGSTPPVGN